jgi:predicted ATP-grasp superfamily ATP-dependent carboligase
VGQDQKERLVQILIHEFVTGGGLWQSSEDPASSPLFAEAKAMVAALAADFAALPNTSVQVTRDSRLPAFHPDGCQVNEIGNAEAELALLGYLASQANWTLLIAPETAGVLAQRAGLVEMAGGKLLSPSTPFILLTSNKQATADVLAHLGFPVPRGAIIALGDPAMNDIPFPAVLKPIDGCGSQNVRLISSPEELPIDLAPGRWRLEEFVPGLSASVALLCGPKEYYVLPACAQRLSSDGRFTYLGGQLRLPPKLDGRARRLGLAAARVLPPAIGYVGVDLVLGEASDGSGDRVIEVNPRVTTSYVGLRAASPSNLAAAMLAAAEGKPADLRFGSEAIEFTADGKIHKAQ